MLIEQHTEHGCAVIATGVAAVHSCLLSFSFFVKSCSPWYCRRHWRCCCCGCCWWTVCFAQLQVNIKHTSANCFWGVHSAQRWTICIFNLSPLHSIRGRFAAGSLPPKDPEIKPGTQFFPLPVITLHETKLMSNLKESLCKPSSKICEDWNYSQIRDQTPDFWEVRMWRDYNLGLEVQTTNGAASLIPLFISIQVLMYNLHRFHVRWLESLPWK